MTVWNNSEWLFLYMQVYYHNRDTLPYERFPVVTPKPWQLIKRGKHSAKDLTKRKTP